MCNDYQIYVFPKTSMNRCALHKYQTILTKFLNINVGNVKWFWTVHFYRETFIFNTILNI